MQNEMKREREREKEGEENWREKDANCDRIPLTCVWSISRSQMCCSVEQEGFNFCPPLSSRVIEISFIWGYFYKYFVLCTKVILFYFTFALELSIGHFL